MRSIPTYICWPDGAADRSILGGKAVNLAALRTADVTIPEWFVLAPQAFLDSLSGTGRTALRDSEDHSIKHDCEAITEGLSLTDTVRRAIDDALQRLAAGRPCRFAVRSSAQEEDAGQCSFAGQFESFLSVQPDDVAARVVDVWRSAYSPRVLAYLRAQSINRPPQPPAVLVQRMVEAEAAGVAFSADPVSNQQDVAVVSAVRGLGDCLVHGTEEGATYRVDQDGQLLSTPGSDAVLTEAEAVCVAGVTRQVAQHFGSPQDVEWALADGTVYLLQARPITTLQGGPDPDPLDSSVPVTLWDNSNLAESYSGVVTPLTFSFAQRAYSAVYPTFCRALGVPDAKIEQHAPTFRSMIGLVRGRMYYNLVSWYEVLALLPGYALNRSFMEQMMGVSDRLPAGLLPERTAASWWARIKDTWPLGIAACRLIRWHHRLPQRAVAFMDHVENALTVPAPGLHALRLDELAAYYWTLEDKLLRQWTVPIVNDFMTMIFAGFSRKLTDRWMDDPSLHAHLLVQDATDQGGGMISVEPVRRMQAMAHMAACHDALVDTLLSGTTREAEAAIHGHPDLHEAYEAYLTRFGDRCLGELKLESPTLHDDPRPLLRAVGNLARKFQPRSLEADEPDESTAENTAALLNDALSGPPVQRRILRWVIRHACARIATRENLRFERTRVFGMARRIFLEMGQRLAAEDHLDTCRDVFYLTVDELLGFAEGTTPTTNLRGLVAARRDEYAAHAAQPAPPNRFTTHGAVGASPIYPVPVYTVPVSDQDTCKPVGDRSRTGLGCSAGTVQGRVRLVRDPHDVEVEANDILVARHTDPGWVSLFAACRGLIVAQGNLLSHAAIVAREMRLPAVVGITDVFSWLADGDLVELDGRTGTVCKLDSPDAAARPHQTASSHHDSVPA